MGSKERLFLVDGSSYAYRAYYALPNLTTSKGFPTNAIYGFINMIKKLLKEMRPNYLAVAFDHKGPTFRHGKFKGYKITRKPMPDSLTRQMPLIKEITQGYNIPIFEIPGYEADDILAHIALKGKETGFDIYIVSSDKDVFQIVDDSIFIYHPQKGMLLDRGKIKEIYGFEPKLIPDYLALMGDQTDNIPGVPGIGDKTARELINRFGSIEEILEKLDELPQKIKVLLTEYKDQLLLSKELAKINLDLDLQINWEDLRLKEPNLAKLIALFEKLEFNSLIKETLQSIRVEFKPTYEIIEDEEGLEKIIKQIEERGSISFYLERGEEEEFLSGATSSLVIGVGGGLYLLKDKSIWGQGPLKEILQSPNYEKITFGAKEVYKILKGEGIQLNGNIFDVKVVAYLLDPSWEKYSLSKIALNYSAKGPQTAAILFKAEEDPRCKGDLPFIYCQTLMEVYEPLKSLLRQKNLERLYKEIEEPLIGVLAEMERRGIAIDKDYLQQLLATYKEKLNKISEEIYQLAGCRFNLNSPKQLRQILYQKLKLRPIKRGKTGPSTDEETLRTLSKDHPLPDLILKYRELNKIISTYIEGLLNSINPHDCKIHATFNQTGTETGRLSCSNPNLQNIPIRSELGKQIRKAFIPSSENFLLLSADYSQIELRLLAHLSKDERLLKAFWEGKDIHRHTASLIFGVDEEIVSDEMRDIAKTVNFGIIYGISPFGLSKQLNMPQSEASKFIKFYFQLYPGVKLYIEKKIAEAKERNYVCTLFNRIRYIPEINALDPNLREFGERLAINTPIQGSAADLIKKAMIEVTKEIKERKLRAYLLLQIHDELLFEVDRENLDLLKGIVKDKMENILSLDVPLVVNVKVGRNWLELK